MAARNGTLTPSAERRVFKMGDLVTEPVYGSAANTGGQPVLLLAAGSCIDSEVKLRRLQEAGYAVALPNRASTRRESEKPRESEVAGQGPTSDFLDPGSLAGIPFHARLDEAEKVRTTIARLATDLQERMLVGELEDLEPVREWSDWLAGYVISDPQAMATVVHLKQCDNYTMEHSANVAILMVGMGSVLGYREADLREIALAGLMHDVGKQKIPREILEKNGPLSREEFEIVRRHPHEGLKILSSLSCSDTVRAVAMEHHERLDGSGYPHGLAGDRVHPYSRIAAVADCFDAMTADRVYRVPVPARQALLDLWSLRGQYLDEALVSALAMLVGVYPVGTYVYLESGELAVVTAPCATDAEKPVVRIERDRLGRPLRVPLLLDTSGSGPSIVQVEETDPIPLTHPIPVH
jgi:putative nucleotidyltransferase with HDIG domain